MEVIKEIDGSLSVRRPCPTLKDPVLKDNAVSIPSAVDDLRELYFSIADN